MDLSHLDTIVICDNPKCGHQMRVPWAIPESPIWAQMDFATYERLMVLDNNWLIDLHGEDESLLVGQENMVANGYDRDQLIAVLRRFPVNDDQEYCCMACVRATAAEGSNAS